MEDGYSSAISQMNYVISAKNLWSAIPIQNQKVLKDLLDASEGQE